MLNCDYKILAKTLAKRLSFLLPNIVHPNQTGFIPSRYIGHNIRNLQALMDFTQETGRSGLIVSLDFRAAFDSVSHQFLEKALESYNLGERFLAWISTLYSQAESCVLNCGQSSGWFPCNRGVRQGCPISPSLFVLAAEKLAEAIRRDNNIKGLDLLDTTTKILQFADDSTLFVKEEESLDRALVVIDNFREVSGLELNLQKTQGIMLGPIEMAGSNSREIQWGNRFKILGIQFDSENSDNKDKVLNFDPAISKMKKICSSWSLRNLSLKGRTVILNTLVLPIISFQYTMLPVPQETIREIDNLVTNFLWRDRKPKISKLCLEKKSLQGGLGLHNVQNRIKAAKLSWLRRLIGPPTEPWQYYLEFKADCSGYELAQQRRNHKKLEISAPFYGQIFRYWRELYSLEPETEIAMRNESLWGNSFLKGKVKKKYETFCRSLGINKINDLILWGKILSEDQFRDRYNLSPIPDLLSKMKDIIPAHWLVKMSTIDPILSNTCLFIKNHKGEWVDFHSLPTKKDLPEFGRTEA